jgi:hypothetical protein
MKTITDLTIEQVRKSPYLLDALRDGIINLSAYARQIMPSIEKNYGDEVKLTSVIMAIQRMDFGVISHEGKKLKAIFKKLKNIQVRGHLFVYTIKVSATIQKNIAKLFIKISGRNDITCTFTQGVFECTLLISGSEAKLVEMILQEETIMQVTRNLSAFIILLPPENTQLSGLYYHILKQLAWEGINIVDVVSTTNEFTILVEDKNSGKCFEALQNL